jgi:two-component system LytT family response regulator
MIKVVIIDDEPLAISVVKNYLSSFKDMNVVGECGNGFEGIKAIAEYGPDLVFLDIQMPKINGFEMLELLDEPYPPVIFTTAFDEYAVKAFEVYAVDYLLKPFSKDRFDKAINKWSDQRSRSSSENRTKELIALAVSGKEEQNRIVVKSGNNIHIIPTQEIIFIEAYDDYVKLNTAKDCFLKKKTMQFYEQVLHPEQFVRVHRSFIVQLAQVTRIEPKGKDSHVALLKNGTRIPLSKNGFTKLREILTS